jgi:hypothetical protein
MDDALPSRAWKDSFESRMFQGYRSGSAYLNRFTPRDKDTAGGLN